MGKATGGTRNFSNRPKALAKRKKQFDDILATGIYNESYFDASGGFYVVHKDHTIKENSESKERLAALALAKKGYRVYLMPDQSYVNGLSKTDGFTEHAQVDIKTILKTGKATIKNALEKASKQGAEMVLLVQNSQAVNRGYITQQIQLFKDTPGGKHNVTLKAVWVVSADGKRIHRRLI